MKNPNLDADCSAVQKFTAEYPDARAPVAVAMREVPQLVECLVTHELVLEYAPPVALPESVENLRAFGLNFKGADLSHHEIRGGRLRGCNFTGVTADQFTAVGVEFIGCYFHGSDFTLARFEGCTFIGCEISKNDFRDARFVDSWIRDCDLYANWARGMEYRRPNYLTPLDQFQIEANFGREAFGFGEKPVWEEGLCDGHEVAETAQ